MKKFIPGILASLVMIFGILVITNPGFKQPYKLFDHSEGKLSHNYWVFSVYELHQGYTLTADGKFRKYRRYVGVLMNFFEISPAQVRQEP
jgi:hypothetical protein